MSGIIEGHTNYNDITSNMSITLNTSSFSVILPKNAKRIRALLTLLPGGRAMISCTPVASAQNNAGIILTNAHPFEIDRLKLYTGEICGKAVAGSPVVYILEY